MLHLPDHAKIFLYRNKAGFHVLDDMLLPADKAFFVEGKIKNRSFGEGFTYADRMVLKVMGERVFNLVDRSCKAKWTTEPATDLQKKSLAYTFRKLGKPFPQNLTKGDASQFLRQLDATTEPSRREGEPAPSTITATA